METSLNVFGYQIRKDNKMKKMPSRDTNGKCRGECRDRAYEGEVERQSDIDSTVMEYSTPASNSPAWTSRRKEQPGVMGGRV
jgi:hypothetical protein